MTDKLPDNIIEIDVLRIKYNAEKKCKCMERKFTVDYQNKLIYCQCGSLVDPFDAMYYLATHYQRLNEQAKSLLEQRRTIANYKPRMVVFKELESRYRGKHAMLPECPRCGKGFRFEEIKGWINPMFADGLRKREEAKE